MKRWGLGVFFTLLLAVLSLLFAPLAQAAPGLSAPAQAPACPPDAGMPVGCVDVSLLPATLTADFYVNGVLAVPGARAARLIVPHDAQAHLEARNIVEASSDFGDAYRYEDASAYLYVAAGEVRSTTFQPRKVYLKGVVQVTCDVHDVSATDDVTCRPTVDGAPQPALPPGQMASYNLPSGTHTLEVTLTGAQAGQWDPPSFDRTLSVTVGATQTVSATFIRKGLLTINLSQQGVVGDLYVDGSRVGDQALSVQVWVTPLKTHQVQGRNFNDPLAGGAYHWKDASATASVSSGGQSTVTLVLSKDTQKGFLDVTCQVNGMQPGDDVACDVKVDNASQGTLAAGGQGHYSFWPGSHGLDVNLTGADAAAWNSPFSQTVNIQAMQTSQVIAVFNTLASQPPIYPAEKLSLSGVGPNLRDIYLLGQSLGNNSRAFSKIGDSDTWTPRFFQPISDGDYDLGSYGYLQDVITYFSPSDSFSGVGHAAFPGFMAQAIVDPLWADPGACHPDESPLACEYRLHRPSVALIMVRTWWITPDGPGSSYDLALRRIVEYSIQQGVIPVLSTQPHLSSPWPPEESMNPLIRQVAADYNVPLWDLWATTEPLPSHGVNANYHLNWAPDDRTTYFLNPYFRYGETRRNLEALMVLHEILHKVIQP